MKAFIAADGPDLVEEADLPAPPPGPDRAVVDVRAVSVNRGELHRLLTASPGWRPGWDFSGIIANPATSGKGPTVGARVFGLALGGSWAEQVAVPVSQLALIPKEISWEEAAAMPTAALTALRVLRLVRTESPRSVLVSGAAGGVGRFAIQLARLKGADVTAVVGRPERAEGLESLGATAISIGSNELIPGFDLILESIGGDSLRDAVRLIASNGTIVSFGNSSRRSTLFPTSDFYAKQAILRGYHLLADVVSHPPAKDLEYLAGLVAQGEFTVEVATQAEWRDVNRLLSTLRRRRVAGKAVLHVSAGPI